MYMYLVIDLLCYGDTCCHKVNCDGVHYYILIYHLSLSSPSPPLLVVAITTSTKKKKKSSESPCLPPVVGRIYFFYFQIFSPQNEVPVYMYNTMGTSCCCVPCVCTPPVVHIGILYIQKCYFHTV